jgi:hypothetical protein
MGRMAFLETKGYPAPAKIPARAQDPTVAQQLWKESNVSPVSTSQYSRMRYATNRESAVKYFISI